MAGILVITYLPVVTGMRIRFILPGISDGTGFQIANPFHFLIDAQRIGNIMQYSDMVINTGKLHAVFTPQNRQYALEFP